MSAPARLRLAAHGRGIVAKVAVTERAADIDTAQVMAVPVHAPLQPAKVEPAAGVAVNVTVVPTA